MAFWQAVTGFEVEAENPRWGYLRDPAGRAPGLGFQKVPEGKVVKNRVHIDLYTPDHEAAAARIEGLGARRLWVSENPEDPFIVLADPEGNEFCVVHEAPE
jgi:predicted enzyme related to lactoylglutathione lyase